MASLLINADDFGLHHSVNTAIEKSVDFGSVNSVSIIASGLAPDFEMLRRLQAKRVFLGAHITWVGEPWLTKDIVIKDWKELLRKLMTGGPSFRSQLYTEGEAQIDSLLTDRINPDHIDSHQHVHHFPILWHMTLALKKKYNIPRIRVASTDPAIGRNGISGMALNMLATVRKREGAFKCAGVRHAGHYDISMILAELRLSHGKNIELIVHPGSSNYEMNKRYSDWRFDWESEYRALLDPNFLLSISDLGFNLIRK
jgi:predicted glycoside hydrolase/deacetylase ChbG (UPF0249 family)